ncbi:hypothetical protein [Xinzhou nematode virus 1]|uniref:hypothetical protein n=1 Tax=Xinzhou nematode virus 1 TaxID=1923769 RepID=UPI00090C4D03|nr:hypothetical protein [Xinzhou nematode virus 1]APG77855.1 hypothetical protein [Xinzhou nematode virus 1]
MQYILFFLVSSVFADHGLRVHHVLRTRKGYFDPYLEKYFKPLQHVLDMLAHPHLSDSDFAAFTLSKEQYTKKIQDYMFDIYKQSKSSHQLVMGVAKRRPVVYTAPADPFYPRFAYYGMSDTCWFKDRSANFIYFLNNPDPSCMSAIDRHEFEITGCKLASQCSYIQAHHFFNTTICYGRRGDNVKYMALAPYKIPYVPLTRNSQQIFSIYCNITTSTIVVLPTYFLQSYDNVALDYYNYTLHHPYITLVDFSYQNVFLPMLHSSFSPLQLKLDQPFKYVCNDSLFEKTSFVDDYNVFRSPRGCENFIYFYEYEQHINICVDYLFLPTSSLISKCPDDWNDFSSARAPRNYVTLIIRSHLNDTWSMIKYNIDYFISRLSKTILQISTTTFDSFIRTFDTYFLKFLDLFQRFLSDFESGIFFKTSVYENFFAYLSLFLSPSQFNLRQLIKDSIVFFFKTMTGNFTQLPSDNETLYMDTNMFGLDIGKWLADAFTSILKPFWQLFLTILEDALNIISDFLFDLVPLLQKFVFVFQRTMGKFLDLLTTIIKILATLLLHIIVYFDTKIFLSEYLILYIFLAYYWRSTIPPLIFLIILILIFGITRRFPSLFLLLLNKEFRDLRYLGFNSSFFYHIAFNTTSHNNTHDSVFIFLSHGDINMTVFIPKHHLFENFTLQNIFLDYSAINTTSIYQSLNSSEFSFWSYLKNFGKFMNITHS